MGLFSRKKDQAKAKKTETKAVPPEELFQQDYIALIKTYTNGNVLNNYLEYLAVRQEIAKLQRGYDGAKEYLSCYSSTDSLASVFNKNIDDYNSRIGSLNREENKKYSLFWDSILEIKDTSPQNYRGFIDGSAKLRTAYDMYNQMIKSINLAINNNLFRDNNLTWFGWINLLFAIYLALFRASPLHERDIENHTWWYILAFAETTLDSSEKYVFKTYFIEKVLAIEEYFDDGGAIKNNIICAEAAIRKMGYNGSISELVLFFEANFDIIENKIYPRYYN